MLGRMFTTPVHDSEILGMRGLFFFGWVLIVGGLPWLFWSDPQIQLSIFWPIGLTVVSLPLGWFLGFKRMIGLWGFVVTNNTNKPRT